MEEKLEEKDDRMKREERKFNKEEENKEEKEGIKRGKGEEEYC